MICEACGGKGRIVQSRARFNGWRWWRIECQDCGQRWSKTAPPGNACPTQRMGRLTEAQVIEALTTPTRSSILARRWRVSRCLVEQVRRRLVYRKVRPDLPKWSNPNPAKVVPLEASQIEWILLSPLSHAQAGKLIGRSPKTIRTIRSRERDAYAHVRPDLPAWEADAPWLVDEPPPNPLARPVQQGAARSCLNCEQYSGLSRPCLLGHDAIHAAGFRAAASCPDYQEEADDDDELEAAG